MHVGIGRRKLRMIRELILIGYAVFFLGLLIYARYRYLDKRQLVQAHLCEWCKKGIEKDDRQEKYQTSGGQVMCPHCWEMTRVVA